MKNLQNILYGIIIGHWLMGAKGRLFPGMTSGRYAVIGMHSSRDEYVLVGRCNTYGAASSACDHVEEYALQYIGLLYDLMDREDREEFSKKKFTEFVEEEDRGVIEEARCRCESGK